MHRRNKYSCTHKLYFPYTNTSISHAYSNDSEDKFSSYDTSNHWQLIPRDQI